MSGAILSSPVLQVFDDDGNPGVGYLLYSYEVGTSTPKALYTDVDLTIPHSNPVVMDDRGEATIYYGDAYKLILKTSLGVTVWTVPSVGEAPAVTPSYEYSYYPDPDESDQGVPASGDGDTIYDILDSIGTGKMAQIVLRHTGESDTTEYQLGTTIDASNYDKVTFYCEPGAIFTRESGAESFHFFSPGNIKASNTQQIFDSAIAEFAHSGVVYPQWWAGNEISRGSANATLAIRYAYQSLDDDEGGVIWLSSGTYKVYPQTAGVNDNVFLFQKDNLTLCGEGMMNTKLDFYALNGNDPEQNWEVIAPTGAYSNEVWRGYGIYMPGGSTLATARKNIMICDLELDGNCEYNGPYHQTGTLIWPADPVTGDGWDISHRAIYGNLEGVDAGYYDNVRFERLWIHNWKGECVGGAVTYDDSISKFYLIDCLIHDTNANCMSYNGKLISHGCEMYNCVYGYEMSYRQGHTILQQNTVHRADFAGIALSNGGEGMPYGPIIVKDNNVYSCAENGIVCVDATDIVLANNDIVDCGTLDGFSAIRVLHSDERVENVHIMNNRIVANNDNLTQGITISAGTTYDASNVVVKDNIVALTKHAVDAGYSLTLPYYYEGDFGDDCIFDGNKTLEYGGDSWEIYEELLTTTSVTNILSIVPGQAAFYVVDIYYRVVTAATDVLIVVSFYDQSDTAVNEIVVNESSVAVGSYVLPSTTILTNATNLIQVAVTAGTANQVYASAKLRAI